MKKGLIYILLAGFITTLSSCSGKKRDPSIVFMPDMYYSVAYEPFSDANFGYWPERDAKQSNIPLLVDYANMSSIWPAEGSVPRTDEQMILPWEFKNTNQGYRQSIDITVSPLKPENRERDLEIGEKLYGQTCLVCHGSQGDGQGPIVQSRAYSGVPTYDERDITVGSVYHVIMYGRGTMGSYAAQLTPVDRWRVAEYVMKLKGVDTLAGVDTEDIQETAETENNQ